MTFSHERVGSSKVRLSSSEAVLLEGRYTPTLLNPAVISGEAMACTVAVFTLVALLMMARGSVDEPVRIDIALGVILALWGIPVFRIGWGEYRRSGRYQLGEENLIWEPHEGPAVQVRLRDIDRLDLYHSTQQVYIALKNGMELRLVSISEPDRLALFLHIKTWMLRENIVITGERVDAVCRRGLLTFTSGIVIIRPGRLVFLPHPGHAVTGDFVVPGAIWDSLEHWTCLPYLPSAELISHLCWLPEREFDQCLQRAMGRLKGVCWTKDEVRSSWLEDHGEDGSSLELLSDAQQLSISYSSYEQGWAEADKELLMRSASPGASGGT